MKKLFMLTFFILSVTYNVEISKSFKDFKLSFVNPVFNPTQNQSAVLSFSDKNFYMNLEYSEKPKPKDPLHLAYQLDWNKQKRLNFTAKAGSKDFYISTDGLGFEHTFNLKPLKLTFKETLSDKTEYLLSLKADNFLRVQWKTSIGKPSRYGGNSQEKDFSFLSEISTDSFSFRSESTTQFKEETGRFSWTDFNLSFKNISCSTRFERTEGKTYGFTDPVLKLSFENVSFELRNKKFYLSLKYRLKNLNITINQNGEINLNFNFAF